MITPVHDDRKKMCEAQIFTKYQIGKNDAERKFFKINIQPKNRAKREFGKKILSTSPITSPYQELPAQLPPLPALKFL